MMKRAFIMIFSLAIFSVAGMAFDYKYKDVTFKCKLKGGSVCITGFDTDAKTVTIPSVVMNGAYGPYEVLRISLRISGINYATTSLIIEEGIRDISTGTFNGLRNLKKLKLPSTIAHIGRNPLRNKNVVIEGLPDGKFVADIVSGREYYTPAYMQQMAIENDAARRIKQLEKEIADEKERAKQDSILKVLETERLAIENKRRQDSLREVARQEAVHKAELLRQDSIHKVEEARRISLARLEEERKKINVDSLIPGSKTPYERTNTYVVIIANEEYKDAPSVEFAGNDGEIFYKYCVKTLNIPEGNILFTKNATLTNIFRALSWLSERCSIAKGRAKVLFYYAGHGLPSESAEQSAYMVPVDADPKLERTLYKMSDLYDELGRIRSQNTTVLLDACFSGSNRNEDAVVPARAMAIRPREESVSGNIVVISAAKGNETAHSYKQQGHGLFTYFLLNKLYHTQGVVRLGDLFDSLSDNVREKSLEINHKSQTPTVNPSRSMKDKWRDIEF